MENLSAGKKLSLVAGSVLWVFLVYLLFYRLQKPFTVETFLAFADSLLNFALALFILLLGRWVLFLATVKGDAEQPIMFPPLPLVTLALLWWRRREADG
jgi:hypothetical protein